LPRSIDPVAREWEKWLKGPQPLLSVTFEQETASENPKVLHLTVVHPLVRQAVSFLDLSQAKYSVVTTRSDQVAPGLYHFALYRWIKHGIKPDESLVAVVNHPQVEAAMFDLLRSATKAGTTDLPTAAVCEELDARHHAKWSEAQANHMAQNRELAEHRVQSLTASHRARCRIIEDQVNRATNEKLRLMKESELARASADFDRRIEDLHIAAASSDIGTTPVVFGAITVTGMGPA
jgi:ATP-dependent helicase HepA